MSGLVALVTGGRDYADPNAVWRALEALRPSLVIHGCARGTDHFADQWCMYQRASLGLSAVEVWRYPAEWDVYGRAAGRERNALMCLAAQWEQQHGRRVVCVWFPGGVGTEHCMRTAADCGLEVVSGEALAAGVNA